MLRPVHKNTVKAMLRKNIPFMGYIAPCNVNSFHINGGWHLGMKVHFTTLNDMEETILHFAWYNCDTNELGKRVRFWTE